MGKRTKHRTTFLSEDDRESYLVSLAKDQAQEQLENGTASSQIVCHYIKAGTVKDQIELEMLKNQSKLIEAKTTSIINAQRTDQIVENALRAFMRYAGKSVDDDDE